MMQVAAHYPVAVIGSGPVGLTLVNLLGKLGVQSLLVERNATTVQEPRAVSIDDESLRTMQAAGVVDEVLKNVVPGYGSHYYSPSRICFAKVEPTGAPYGYPRRNAFRQPILERQLKESLAKFDHVDTLYGWRLGRYEQSAEKVTLHLIGPADALRKVTCDYLVGCDGAASLVREQQGIQLEGTTFEERWLIIDLENNENTTKHTEVFCDQHRPCITLPGPHRTRRFEFKLVNGEKDEDLLAPAVIKRLLRTHGADPNATLRRKVVYRFHARVAPRWSFGRVFLAGDACHLTPPFAGQGMNSGIRDAHNLAWKLAAVLARRAGPKLLDTYEQERKDHVWQMIQLALRMGRVMSPSSWLPGFFTQTAFLALNAWPPARDYVVQMKYKPPPYFHAGFLVPDGKARKSLIGRLFPQPLVRDAAGREVLLDEVLGNRFVLLSRTRQVADSFAKLRQPVWDKLGATRVALLSADAPAQAADGVEVIRETNDALDVALTAYSDTALLLRPDHYVAAAIPLDDVERATRAIESLLAATWPDKDDRSALSVENRKAA
jgi:3-(3-hydroxy-phenyl)propionate hydroxylase